VLLYTNSKNTYNELYISSKKEEKGQYARLFKKEKDKNRKTGDAKQKKKGQKENSAIS